MHNQDDEQTHKQPASTDPASAGSDPTAPTLAVPPRPAIRDDRPPEPSLGRPAGGGLPPGADWPPGPNSPAPPAAHRRRRWRIGLMAVAATAALAAGTVRWPCPLVRLRADHLTCRQLQPNRRRLRRRREGPVSQRVGQLAHPHQAIPGGIRRLNAAGAVSLRAGRAARSTPAANTRAGSGGSTASASSQSPSGSGSSLIPTKQYPGASGGSNAGSSQSPSGSGGSMNPNNQYPAWDRRTSPIFIRDSSTPTRKYQSRAQLHPAELLGVTIRFPFLFGFIRCHIGRQRPADCRCGSQVSGEGAPPRLEAGRVLLGQPQPRPEGWNALPEPDLRPLPRLSDSPFVCSPTNHAAIAAVIVPTRAMPVSMRMTATARPLSVLGYSSP